ncbi:UPF0587 protein CG4646 isoform X1 [Halyomorpha halys]|uniref:UPF0587 protein CG4646 isoform X1 n=1 Tax=Halyomorpha halys TaxID=286706 RepID=UPI0006D522B5|nr:UPF0587 protein CG4646 isoform X2 [Halyomorpha halys]
MVKVRLLISCTLENINQLSTSGPDFQWNIKLQCRNCNEIDQSWHAINENEEVSGSRGPGSFNFQMKCKFCSSVSTIDIVKDSVKPLKTDGDVIIKQTAVVFDCRGVEPVQFDPQDGWIAKCDETGSVFSEVEFGEDGMWAGYDEKGNFPDGYNILLPNHWEAVT